MKSHPRQKILRAGVIALVSSLGVVLLGGCRAQAPDSERYPPIDWPSRPPVDCPFEPSEDIVGVTFTGRHREYARADCWFPSWASDGNMYSPFSDGTVEIVLPDGSREQLWTLGQEGEDANCGCGKIVGDDPLNLTVIGLGVLPTPTGPYNARYPSGSLVHDGIWYYGSHPEGPGGLGPLVGFRVSRDHGKTWTDGPNDPTAPLFAARSLDDEGQPTGIPVRIGEPFFVDFGKNMEHSPDGKAYLIAHGATARDPDPLARRAHWNMGDEAYLLRVTPSPETINDASEYEFFAGHDEDGKPIWTGERAAMKPLIEWKGKVGPTSITYNPHLERYLLCVTDGSVNHGAYDTYILESPNITGPWKLAIYMEHFGEEGYFVNIPSKFIGEDGRTAWLCYAANFSVGMPDPPPLESNPPGSRYGMNLQEIRLRAKD